jgi:hypothetical protein
VFQDLDNLALAKRDARMAISSGPGSLRSHVVVTGQLRGPSKIEEVTVARATSAGHGLAGTEATRNASALGVMGARRAACSGDGQATHQAR